MTLNVDRPTLQRQVRDPHARPPVTTENEAAQSPSLMLLVLLASAGVVIYGAFLANPANRGDWLPYVMVMAAETILVLHALLAMWTVLSSGHNPRGFAIHTAQDQLYDTGEILRE